MELAHPLPSDGQLADAARRGSTAAWEELTSRHGRAVQAVARARRTKSPRAAADAALERLHQEIRQGPAVEEGAPATRAFRARAIASLTGGRYGPGGAEDEPVTVGDDAVLAGVFERLPEPWQTALWHSVVEQRSAGEMTPLLGRGVNDVLALLHTARSGLHQAYLRELAEVDGASLAGECRPVVPLLSAAGRGALAALDQRIVDAHIMAGRGGAPCRDCRARLDLVSTIDERLPAAIVPGLTGMPVERYREAIGAGDGPIGAAALDASRSDRWGRLAIAGAALAVAIAIVGAFLLIRRPFEGQTLTSAPASRPVATTATGETVPATDPTLAPSTTPIAPTTTELLLRPPPSGPGNTVELVFVGGERALGLTAPELPLAVELEPAGRVLAAGTGTFDLTVTNTGAEPLAAHVEVRTPPGLLFDDLADGDATCRGPRDDAAFCNFALDAGESTTLAIRLRLESSVVGRLVVDPGTFGVPLELAIEATPRLVHSSVGRGEILMIGNTVVSCAPSAPECAGARDLTGAVINRWDLPMEYVGATAELGNSSSAALDLPPGAGVEAAYLFWSGDLDERGRRVAEDERRQQVTLLAPGAAAAVVVEAERLFLGDVDATQYLGFADVSELIRGAGDVTVGDVTTVEIQGTYGGWSLVVVTADDAQPRRQHLVTSPFAWVAPDYRYRATIPVPFARSAPLELDVLGFEGEPGFAGERFVVSGEVIGEDNPFDGSIVGAREPSFVNNFGIDVEAYDLVIDASDGTLAIDASSTEDGVRLAVLAVSVDLPS